MRPQELRIGNLVDLGKRIAKVIDIGHNSCTVVDLEETQDTLESYERTQGIVITEEWLLKFGFCTSDWDNHSTLRKQLLDSSLVYDKESKTFDLGDLLNIKIEYVHQVQNLYFALTSEELLLS